MFGSVSLPLPITELPYFSLFSYVTERGRKDAPIPPSIDKKLLNEAKSLMVGIINEKVIKNPLAFTDTYILASQFVAAILSKIVPSNPIWQNEFTSDAILVPVPRSSQTKK
ncbi:MAG: hypothetical protein QW115_00830 [Thermoplasmata archaeon]